MISVPLIAIDRTLGSYNRIINSITLENSDFDICPILQPEYGFCVRNVV